MRSNDLIDRTKAFAIRMLRLVEAIPDGTTGRVVARQVARSATSVGANYRACCRARSRKEFISKMSIVIEECDESAYWLEIVRDADLLPAARIEPLLEEANQLTAIFVKSRHTARTNLRK